MRRRAARAAEGDAGPRSEGGAGAQEEERLV